MTTIRSALQGIGLSDKEITVYLTLLATGGAPASTLCKRVSLPRSTVQFLGQQLARRGLVSLSRRGGAVFFVPEPPETVLSVVGRQRRELEERERQMRSVLDEMKRITPPAAATPQVRYYEGVEGLKSCWEELLREAEEGGEIVGYVHQLEPKNDRLKLVPVIDRFIKGRVRKGIRSRLITPDIPSSRLLQQRDRECLRETRIMAGKATPSPTEILLCGDSMYVRTVTPRTVFASVIRNPDMTAMQRAAFEALWERLGA